jgi:hypothetical protein
LEGGVLDAEQHRRRHMRPDTDRKIMMIMMVMRMIMMMIMIVMTAALFPPLLDGA